MLDFLYNLFSGIGFNEPLHPPITHMPIGLAVGALLFFLVAVILKKNQFVLTARHVSILAFIFAFPTILLGVFDWIHYYNAAMITPIIIKMILAGVLLIVLGAGIILGSEIKMRSLVMTILYAVAFVAVIGLGYFGSGLVDGRGVAQGQEALTGDAEAGKTVFVGNCQSCHQNGGNSINPDYPLATSAKLADIEQFIKFVRKPEMRDGTHGDMPPFSEDLISRKEAGSLYAYIKEMAQKWK